MGGGGPQRQSPRGPGRGSEQGGDRAGAGAPAAVVALVDQPLVAPEAIRRLSAAWGAGAMIATATYDGGIRTPVLFDARAGDAAARL